jgi:hypothetical protein
MITLADEIACIRRELAMRRRVYPNWVKTGRMKPAEADTELARMQAVLTRLETLQAFEESTREVQG